MTKSDTSLSRRDSLGRYKLLQEQLLCKQPIITVMIIQAMHDWHMHARAGAPGPGSQPPALAVLLVLISRSIMISISFKAHESCRTLMVARGTGNQLPYWHVHEVLWKIMTSSLLAVGRTQLE